MNTTEYKGAGSRNIEAEVKGFEAGVIIGLSLGILIALIFSILIN